MSNIKLKYVLGKSRYANADNLMGNVKLNFSSSSRLIEESDVIQLVSLVQRYERERQASSTHRIYGKLGLITTNELSDYNSHTITLIEPTTQVHNYNLQLVYPSSHITDIALTDFSCDIFPLLCSYYDTSEDCNSHKIYHGLPFSNSHTVIYNGRVSTVLETYRHKNGNNINAGDYVYVIPGKGGTINQLYGIFKVDSTVLDDGTTNVLILNANISGNYCGSYKKIINPSDNDIKFLNSIDCELYITSSTTNELFICTSEQHNVIVGEQIDLRQNGITYNQYNGIHKVNRVISDFIYTCDVPSHLLWPINPSSIINLVPDITGINPSVFNYQYRVLDGDSSDYYLRKFKVILEGDNTSVITEMDYYLQQLYLSNTIWKNVTPDPLLICDVEKQSGSDDDCMCSYVFNKDINISQYVDNLGRPLTHLYLAFIKRKNIIDFNNLVTNFQGGLMYNNITTFNRALRLPTYASANVKANLDYFSIQQFNDAGLSIGDEYYGDLCEFSIATLEETVLDPLQFRIGKIINGYDVEGYIYEPFKKIQLKYFSNDIDDVPNTESEYPNYALPYHTTYRWKLLNPYGFKEIIQTGVRVVDDPFVNGAHYNFADVTFHLRRQNKNPDIKITIYDTSC